MSSTVLPTAPPASMKGEADQTARPYISARIPERLPHTDKEWAVHQAEAAKRHLHRGLVSLRCSLLYYVDHYRAASILLAVRVGRLVGLAPRTEPTSLPGSSLSLLSGLPNDNAKRTDQAGATDEESQNT